LAYGILVVADRSAVSAVHKSLSENLKGSLDASPKAGFRIGTKFARQWLPRTDRGAVSDMRPNANKVAVFGTVGPKAVMSYTGPGQR